MTNIEQEFFKTFGIEPKDYYSCNWDGYCPYDNEADKCGGHCPYWSKYKNDYPKITDKVLLELICILTGCCNCTLKISAKNLEQLKEGILQQAIERAYYALDKDKYKHQIQSLFREEAE